MSILVIGESCLDVFTYGECNRMCPEAPVPVFNPINITENGGMAMNVYTNLLKMKTKVDIVTNNNFKDIKKTRFIDHRTNHMFMRLDEGEYDVSRCNDICLLKWSDYDAVIISDYCKGFLTEEDISIICKNHPKVFVDTKKIIGDFCKNALIIKINEQEWENSKDYYSASIEDKLVITLGNKGCNYRGKNFSVKDVPVKDQTGAGDTFIAALCWSYLSNENMEVALVFANECAGRVVTTRGVTSI